VISRPLGPCDVDWFENKGGVLILACPRMDRLKLWPLPVEQPWWENLPVRPDAMWYTPIVSQWGEQTLSPEPPGRNRSIAVTKRIRKLLTKASLPYRSPHKFRHGHALYALQHAKTRADYKAVSMNLMHHDIRVTDGIYAPLAGNEVQRRIAGLTGQAVPQVSTDGDLTALINSMPKERRLAVLIAIAQKVND